MIPCEAPCRARRIWEEAMLRAVQTSWLWACGLLMAAGCADNAMVLKGKLGEAQQQQVALQRQNQQLQERATALDRDNQEIEHLAGPVPTGDQSLEDQFAAMREQLRSVTSQLAQARSEKENTDRRVQAMTASMQRQGGVTISPNNSFLQTLPAINSPASSSAATAT